MKMEHPTSNIQHPTSNVWSARSSHIGCWMLDVGCWMFSQPLRPSTRRSAGRSRSAGFTLIELILILAVLAITASLIVPRLAEFFRGRTLDSETRQILAL